MLSTARSIYKPVKRSLIKSTLILRNYNSWFQPEKLMVIAPHPDDEIFGTGGFLLKSIRSGVAVSIVYLTDGEKSLLDIDTDVVSRERIKLSDLVTQRLKIPASSLYRIHLPDGQVPRQGEAGFDASVNRIKEVILEVLPNTVFVTHPLDTWPYDHIAAFEITREALKQTGMNIGLYAYWVWVWYSLPFSQIFKINRQKTFRVYIKDELHQKWKLINIYMDSRASNGKPYSGVLPKAFMNAFKYPYEVFEKIDVYEER